MPEECRPSVVMMDMRFRWTKKCVSIQCLIVHVRANVFKNNNNNKEFNSTKRQIDYNNNFYLL